MDGWGKIALGTRLEKLVESKFVKVWSELISKGLRKGDGYLIVNDLVAHWASNELVRGFLKTNCDTLFILDSDADVGPNFLHTFRDYEPGWKYDVLQSFFVRRGWPPEAIWFQKRDDGAYIQCVVTGDDIVEDVAAVGTHATLFRREVFERLLGDNDPATYQWFYYPRDVRMSEDVAFSRDAVNAGFRFGATTAVKAGHISRVTTGWETYVEYVALNHIDEKAREDALRYMDMRAQAIASANGVANGQVH
jgi:hypothetical protein